MKLGWFETSTTGPAGGMFAAPTKSMRKKMRKMM